MGRCSWASVWCGAGPGLKDMPRTSTIPDCKTIASLLADRYHLVMPDYPVVELTPEMEREVWGVVTSVIRKLA